MKLIAQLRLYPNDDQQALLLQTLEKANAVCNRLSEIAWESKTFRQYDLHKLAYHDTREETGLTAQMVVRCIAKVADAYKLDNETQRVFRKHGAIAYDDRLLSWYTDKRQVSIWSVGGRLRVDYKGGQRQLELLKYRKGETDLVYRKGAFYLLAVCDIPNPDERDVDTALGIDMGVVNIAVTNDGDIFTSEAIEKNRRKHHRLRRDLQRNKSRSTRKKLKRLSGRQRNFQKDVNHRISKRLVELAERTHRMIAIEDLEGIQKRARAVRKEQRGKHSNWSFGQLRDFLTYKAKMAGVKLVVVDPRYTSQRCAACGHIAKENRRSQSQFSCVACGHTAHADVNAAANISRLGCSFNQPHVPTHDVRDNLPPLGG